MGEASRERYNRAEGSDPKISRRGGLHKMGVMRGVSLVTAGEALGHHQWLDTTTLEQVVALADSKGVKVRFTHPGMCDDGLGRLLGRAHDLRVEGGRVLGDLHFSKSAHDTPDGNLAKYVMDLAEEDPEAAGLSIVFYHDREAEDEFTADHLEEVEYEDHHGRTVKEMRFKSPDPNNENNYPHVRLKELTAADIVDEPAANPEGLFDRSPFARQADDLLSYAAGISDKKPEVSAFNVDGDKALQFFNRWLSSRGLTLLSNDEVAAMANEQEKNPEAPEVPEVSTFTKEDLLAEQKKFTDRFGAENGVKWYAEGKSYTECLELYADAKEQEAKDAIESMSKAEERLQSMSTGEEQPVETNPGEESKGVSFAQYCRTVSAN